MESGSGKGTEQEMEQINLKKKHKELLKKGGKSLPFEQMDREENELFKKMGSKSGKGTEIESGKDQGELRKEHERLTTEYEILRRELRIEHLEERAVINPGHSGKKQRERDMLRYLERELNKTEIKLGMGTKRDSGKEPEMERDEMKEPEMERDEMKEQSKLSKKQRKLLKQKHKKLMKKRLKERDSGDLLGSFAPTFSGKHQSLVKEIISVERERRDLLASLTPTFSIWKEIDSQATWTIATKEEPVTARGDENQLADYFNLMLQDMEYLGHRMLSMLHFLNKSNDPIRSYKATELCNTATKLNTHISKGFITDQEPWQEPEQINLLSLFRKYSRFPSKYDNTLAQLVMEEDEEKKYEDVEVEEEEQEKDVSTMEYLKERMDVEQQFFAHNRTFWEDVWGSRIGRCGRFMDTTILSPMQFTHYTPGSIPSPAAVTGSTLQIYSIKIKNLKGLNWPLRVYGEVAARDTVDHNRNILFSRSKFNYQELIGEDHSLCLTGPSRAIVALGDVDFEVELQVTNGAQSQTLISCRERYGGTDAFFSSLASVTDGGDGRTFLLSNQSCTAEVTLEQLDRSLQATIVGVRVTKGGWPFKYGCRIVCSWSPFAATEDIPTTYRRLVLLDHRGKGLPRGSENYLQLSRKVVSVESQGTLRWP